MIIGSRLHVCVSGFLFIPFFVKRLVRILYAAWVLFVFIGSMLVLLPFILLPGIVGEKARPISFFALNLWATLFNIFTGVRYSVEGLEHIDKNAAYIYVSNHTSFLDVPALMLFIPGQFRPLGKKELKKIPVLGWIISVVCILVDRSDQKSRLKSFNELTALIKRKVSILIFPEGSMNRETALLRPFYDGAFRIAIETQAPLLPMVIINAGNLFPPGTARIKPGKIKVRFGTPLSTKGLTLQDIPIIKERTHQVMLDLLEESVNATELTSR